MKTLCRILTLVITISIIFNISLITLANNQGILGANLSTITGNDAGENSFFGLAFRTKYLDRWGILIPREPESLNDHLLDTARIAHMLALIKNKKYGGNVNPERAALLAMYHDLPEIVTDDMPTPVKYTNPAMKPLYDEIEEQAIAELLSLLPEEFQADFDSILRRYDDEQELWTIVKSADTISALIKCLREKSLGNRDLDKAYDAMREPLLTSEAPEVQYFLKTFLPAFGFEAA